MQPPTLSFLFIPTLLCLLLAPLPANAERAAFDVNAPQLLRAVGKLSVPGHDRVDGRRRQRDENCSASLVAPDAILTAWHCLEYYRDLSRDPLFSLPNVPGQEPVAARRISDGGGMMADWALLKLMRPIRSVEPLPVRRYSPSSGELLLAGFARDAGPGAGGEHLTWQGGCRLMAGDLPGTNCRTFRGASGGPVLSGGYIIGVISARDEEQRTLFAPSTVFLSDLRPYIHRADPAAGRP